MKFILGENGAKRNVNLLLVHFLYQLIRELGTQKLKASQMSEADHHLIVALQIKLQLQKMKSQEM